MVQTGRRESEGGGGTESAAGRPSPHASEAGGRVAPRRVTDVLSVQLLFGRSGLWVGVGYDVIHLRRNTCYPVAR